MALLRSKAIIFAKTWCQSQFCMRNCGVSVRLYSKGQAPRKSNIWYLGLLGIGAGAFVGAGYSYHKMNEARKPILNLEKDETVLTEVPQVEVSQKVVYTNDTTDLQLKLFQYATCPFCCKVRAFLDYYGISYDVIEVNPVMRQQIKWSQYKKVPILLAHHQDKYQQLNDSSMIISALMSYLLAQKKVNLNELLKGYPTIVYNEDGKNRTEILNRYFLMYQEQNPDEKTKDALILERKWRKWVDDTFVHVLSPNVYRTREEALETFNWFSQAGDWEKHFPTWERNIIIYIGAYAMWLISKRLKKRHRLKDDVRQSFYDECNVWMRNLYNRGTPYMGGDKPNLADLAMYGVLSSIEGSRAFKDVLKNTKLGVWYYLVQSQVKNQRGSLNLNR